MNRRTLFPTPMRRSSSQHPAASSTLLHMHRDIKEMLIGSAGIILFGAAIIASPSFARFVDQYFFSYFQMVWDLLLHVL